MRIGQLVVPANSLVCAMVRKKWRNKGEILTNYQVGDMIMQHKQSGTYDECQQWLDTVNDHMPLAQRVPAIAQSILDNEDTMIGFRED